MLSESLESLTRRGPPPRSPQLGTSLQETVLAPLLQAYQKDSSLRTKVPDLHRALGKLGPSETSLWNFLSKVHASSTLKGQLRRLEGTTRKQRTAILILAGMAASLIPAA